MNLLTIFIIDKIFDAEINELLIERYSSLGNTGELFKQLLREGRKFGIPLVFV